MHFIIWCLLLGWAQSTVLPDGDKPTEVCCKDNEEYQSCGTACPETCDNLNDTCRICTLQCVQGCFCKKGFVRNKNGDCICPEDCPPRICTGPNEKFQWCPPNCPVTEDCSNIWSRINCTGAPTCCKPRCRCIDGYFRKDGICVTVQECMCNSQCGPNSKFNSCGSACPLTCLYPKPRPCTKQCVPRCVCDEGYLENEKGECIKPDQCPKSPCKCGDNEEYRTCGTACPKTCKNKDAKIRCIALCVAGCFCKDGYVRDANKKCILPDQCPTVPPVCGENEKYDECGTACPLTCDKPKPGICTDQCVKGCFCIDGYVRDKNKKCISPDKCPKPCGANEHYTENDPTCRLTCANYQVQGESKDCKPYTGCVCDKGYVRTNDDATGPCIPPKKCPKPCDCPPHEHFEKDPAFCPDDTCLKNQKGYRCPIFIQKPYSPPRCVCDKGYLRDAKGKCIPAKDCPKPCVCPTNEHFEEDPAFCPDDTCEKNQVGYRCPIFIQKPYSPPRCVCDKGLLRNAKGKCIPAKDCPQPVKCGDDDDD